MHRILRIALLGLLLFIGAGCGVLQPATTPPTYHNIGGNGGNA